MGQQSLDWKLLPQEILGQIFWFLSNRDKLAFTLVCPEWADAIDCPIFWKRIVVNVDEDFIDSSLMYLTQRYLKYMQILEIGWSSIASHSSRLPYMKHKDIVKRTGRFLTMLHDHLVQIQHLTIFDWYDIFHLRKLSYLLMRFVKHQSHLQTVTLNNANLYGLSFVNILISCLRSKTEVRHLNLHFTTYNARRLFDSWIFTNCMELFRNLEELTIDCWIFWQFFNKLQVRICRLKVLNLYLDDSLKKIDGIVAIRETQWEMFFAYLPRATVNLRVEKPISDEQFKNVIQKHYPLLSFTWNYTYYRETCQADCSQCLERLANLQGKSLEYIHLKLPLQPWHLRDKINYIKRKCRKIKSFILNGVELVQRKNYFESPNKYGVIG